MRFWTKLKFVAAMIAVVVLVGGGTGTLAAAAHSTAHDRMASTSAPADPACPFEISGYISAIGTDTISVKQKDQVTDIPFNTATVFRLDLKLVTLADLKVGLAVGVWGTAGKPAVEIRAFTPKPPTTKPAPSTGPALPPGPFEISGTISALAADSITVTQQNKPTLIPINANTVIRVDLQIATLSDLKIGMGVGVWGTNGKPAMEIRAYTPKTK